MGNLYSRLNGPLESCAHSVGQMIASRKRKRVEDDTEDADIRNMLEGELNTPKRYVFCR